MKPREITRVGLGALTPRTKNFRSDFLVKITQKHEKQQGSTLGAKKYLKNRGSPKNDGMWIFPPKNTF